MPKLNLTYSVSDLDEGNQSSAISSPSMEEVLVDVGIEEEVLPVLTPKQTTQIPMPPTPSDSAARWDIHRDVVEGVLHAKPPRQDLPNILDSVEDGGTSDDWEKIHRGELDEDPSPSPPTPPAKDRPVGGGLPIQILPIIPPVSSAETENRRESLPSAYSSHVDELDDIYYYPPEKPTVTAADDHGNDNEHVGDDNDDSNDLSKKFFGQAGDSDINTSTSVNPWVVPTSSNVTAQAQADAAKMKAEEAAERIRKEERERKEAEERKWREEERNLKEEEEGERKEAERKRKADEIAERRKKEDDDALRKQRQAEAAAKQKRKDEDAAKKKGEEAEAEKKRKEVVVEAERKREEEKQRQDEAATHAQKEAEEARLKSQAKEAAESETEQAELDRQNADTPGDQTTEDNEDDSKTVDILGAQNQQLERPSETDSVQDPPHGDFTEEESVISTVTTDLPQEANVRLDRMMILRAQTVEVEKRLDELKWRGLDETNPEMKAAEKTLRKFRKQAERRYDAAVHLTRYFKGPSESDNVFLGTLDPQMAGVKIEENLEQLLTPISRSISFKLTFGTYTNLKNQKPVVVEKLITYNLLDYTRTNEKNKKEYSIEIPEEIFGDWLTEYRALRQ